MAKVKLPVIDSNGKSYEANATWVTKHALQGNGYFADGAFHFYAAHEIAERRRIARPATQHEQPPRARNASMHGHHGRIVTLRPNEPTPDTGGATFLPYPMPRRSAGHYGLKAEYAPLAQPGAGLR